MPCSIPIVTVCLFFQFCIYTYNFFSKVSDKSNMSSKRTKPDKELHVSLSNEDTDLFESAWETARSNHGQVLSFYLPGMIKYGKERGNYPAISITGNRCELMCEHCKGNLLSPMINVTDSEELVNICKRLAKNGAHGILLSGGANHKAKLPWEKYFKAIERISQQTSLYISAHTGFPDYESCCLLKKAGVKQGLIDVMGDEKTATHVYHLNGLKPLFHALDAIRKSGLELIPHIVAGLLHGNIEAEYRALEIISHYQPTALVIVVLTPLKGTPMSNVSPPAPLEVGRLIARARLLMPEIPISLGCERPRNREGTLMEKLAIRAGVNRMAIWSEEAIREAEKLDLIPRFQATCCSLNYHPKFSASK